MRWARRKLSFSEELVVRPDESVREGAIKPWRIGART
jgi:hypothetical protein